MQIVTVNKNINSLSLQHSTRPNLPCNYKLSLLNHHTPPYVYSAIIIYENINITSRGSHAKSENLRNNIYAADLSMLNAEGLNDVLGGFLLEHLAK